MDVEHQTAGDVTRGKLKVQGSDDFQSQTFQVSFQNENLVAEKLKENGICEVCIEFLIRT